MPRKRVSAATPVDYDASCNVMGHKPIIAKWRGAGVVMLTASRVAKGLGISRESVVSLGMPGVKIGHRVRYYLDDLERTLNSLAKASKAL